MIIMDVGYNAILRDGKRDPCCYFIDSIDLMLKQVLGVQPIVWMSYKVMNIHNKNNIIDIWKVLHKIKTNPLLIDTDAKGTSESVSRNFVVRDEEPKVYRENR